MTVYLIFAVVVGGALIAAQGPIYARMATLLEGSLQAAFLAFAIGTTTLFALLVISGNGLPRRAAIADVPWWIWSGGLIGVYVVVTSVFAVPRLGVATYMVCVIVGQLAASYAYDRLGAFGMPTRDFTTPNLIGLSMVAIGAILVVWR